MKYLLDVNALLAAILAVHGKHQIADAWVKKKELATCPLTELGYILISTNPRAYNVSMALAHQSLEAFLAAHRVEFIPADLPASKSNPRKSEEVTDCYLADLAAAKGMKLATLDVGIAHASVEIVK